LLQIVLTLLLSVHLLAVNVSMAGPLACLGLEWRARRNNDTASQNMARLLGRHCLLAFALGVGLGIVLLGLIWLMPGQRYFAALGTIPASRLWFGLGELVFYLGCMAGYLLLAERRGGWSVVRWLLAIFAATNLMLHFPPLFAIISTLASRGSSPLAVLDRTAYYQLLLDPEVMSRVVHVWLASLAVTGALVMGLAARGARRADASLPESDSIDPNSALAVWGARLAVVPTVLQLAVGTWVLVKLPTATRETMLGSDLVATALFMVALISAVRMMHQLAAVALGDTERRQVTGAVWSMALVVVVMVAAWTRTQAAVAEEHDQATSEAALRPAAIRIKTFPAAEISRR